MQEVEVSRSYGKMLENQVREYWMLKIQDFDSVWVLKSLTLFGPSFLTALKRAWPVDSQLKKVEKWTKLVQKWFIDVD